MSSNAGRRGKGGGGASKDKENFGVGSKYARGEWSSEIGWELGLTWSPVPETKTPHTPSSPHRSSQAAIAPQLGGAI